MTPRAQSQRGFLDSSSSILRASRCLSIRYTDGNRWSNRLWIAAAHPMPQHHARARSGGSRSPSGRARASPPGHEPEQVRTGDAGGGFFNRGPTPIKNNCADGENSSEGNLNQRLLSRGRFGATTPELAASSARETGSRGAYSWCV